MELQGGFSLLNHSSYMGNVQNVLNQYGNEMVTGMQIFRRPIPGVAQKIVGHFSDLPYDKLFHLGLICNIGGRNLVVEKTAYVNVSLNYSFGGETEVYNIPQPFNFTVNQMLDKAKKTMGVEQFFSYDAWNNNCQVFCRICLMVVNKLTPDGEKFINQHAEQIKKDIPKPLQVITKGITNLGNIWARITGGNDQMNEIEKDAKNWLVQSIMFSYDWTHAEAKKWLDEHGIEPIKQAHDFPNHFRYRVLEPKPNTIYRSVNLNNGIIIVLIKNPKAFKHK